MSSLKALFNSLIVLLFLFVSLFSLTVLSDSSLPFLFAEIPHTFLCVLHFSLYSLQYTNQSFFFNFPRRSSKAGQKARVDGISSRPPKGDRDPFFLMQVWLWEVLWSFFSVQPLSWSSPSYKIHFSSHVTIQLRNGSLLHRIKEDSISKQWFFFRFSVSSWGHPLIELFHLSNLLQMPNDHRIINVEFLGN